MPTTVVLFVAVPINVHPLGTVIDVTFDPPAYAIEAIITSFCATPAGVAIDSEVPLLTDADAEPFGVTYCGAKV